MVTATIALPGLSFLFDPLSRKSRKTGFVRVARVGELPTGEPVRVVVTADRWDGFIHHPPGPVGSVWLVPRTPASGEADETADSAGETSDATLHESKALTCYQTICPHLGCGTNFDVDRGVFACPCHASDFDLSGQVLSGPSPRGLDELACRVTPPDADGTRWVEVEYREFKIGTPTREPLA